MEPASLLLLLMFALLFSSILAGVPAWLAIGGAPLTVALIGSFAGVFDPVFLTAFPQRVFGMMNNQLFIAIPLFILMGVVLEKTGLAAGMLKAVEQLGGGSQRRMALSVLGISALIAASTGIAGATIVMLGLISYPALVRAGVPEGVSGGLVVSAGTLGQMIPPSIVLIILADQISNAWQQAQRAGGSFAAEPVTVSNLFAAALIPGALLVGLYALYLYLRLPGEGTLVTSGAQKGRQGNPAFLLLPLLLIVAVLGSILFGIATVTEAAALGATGSLLLGGLRKALERDQPFARLACTAGIVFLAGLFVLGLIGWSGPGGLLALALALGFAIGLLAAVRVLHQSGALQPALKETVTLSGVIFAIVMAASLLSLVFRGLNGDALFAEFAVALPGERWAALLLVLAVVFLLGFVLEFIEIIFIVVPIAGPVLFAMGVDPVWFAILLAINLQTSFLTPPMGVALFYFKSVAPAGYSIITLYRGIIPFIFLQLTTLALILLFPDLALALPKWLFG